MRAKVHQWHVFDDVEQVAREAAQFIADNITAVLAQQLLCHVALPGGNTPALCLRYLAAMPLAWERIHWYLTDERCYPQGHTERNDYMLEKNLWSLMHAAPENIHRIAAELGPDQAAMQYAQEISALKQLDIVFLGMGEDGHTASLFPHHAALQDMRAAVPVEDAPKPPLQRVSLSMNSLRQTTCKIVLVHGHGKIDALRQIKAGAELPINQLGALNWFVDAAAYPS